jgi:hypothetical protein
VRRSAVAAIAIVLLELALLAGKLIVNVLGGQGLSGYYFSLSASAFTIVGAVIVWRRPDNAVGWAFAAAGLLWSIGDFATSYAFYGAVVTPEHLPLVTLAAWYGEWFWPLWLVTIFGLIPILFPTGRPLNRRWRVALIVVASYGALVSGSAMLEDRLDIPSPGRWLPNPIGIDGFHDIERGIFAAFAFPMLLLAMAVGLSSIVVRFRRSRGDERQQLKWFAFAVVMIVVEFLAQSVADVVLGVNSEVLAATFLTLVPGAAAIAILRYRLYDIDVVINRTLVYATLTAVLATAYVGLVFGFQSLLAPVTEESDLAIAASTLAVAGLFRPVRDRVQAFIDRRFYRRKFDVEQTLESFSAGLRDEVDLGALSARLTAVVAETMQPAHVSLWIKA